MAAVQVFTCHSMHVMQCLLRDAYQSVSALLRVGKACFASLIVYLQRPSCGGRGCHRDDCLHAAAIRGHLLARCAVLSWVSAGRGAQHGITAVGVCNMLLSEQVLPVQELLPSVCLRGPATQPTYPAMPLPQACRTSSPPTGSRWIGTRLSGCPSWRSCSGEGTLGVLDMCWTSACTATPQLRCQLVLDASGVAVGSR